MCEFQVGDRVRFKPEHYEYCRRHITKSVEEVFVVTRIVEKYDKLPIIYFGIHGAYAYRLELVKRKDQVYP